MKENCPGLKKDHVDMTKLIRSIQRAEGEPVCFRKEKDGCDLMDCPWRAYCLEEPEEDLPED
jgi:hypothetical protein